jgi:hypothetical protein
MSLQIVKLRGCNEGWGLTNEKRRVESHVRVTKHGCTVAKGRPLTLFHETLLNIKYHTP